MKIKAVLFDLDGTLLPMDLKEFFREYFRLLSQKLYPLGFEDSKMLVKTIWQGVDKVCLNDGSRTNGDLFWEQFISVYGKTKEEHEKVMDDFYKNEFDLVKEKCGFTSDADKTVKEIKEMGLRTVVATKPIFPDLAIKKRIEWAGLDVEDFEYYTSYEKCTYCKPSPDYYTEIAKTIGLLPEECLMVGNDVSEDMTAEKCGMKVFLLTDCLINSENIDISRYNHGNFSQLLDYIKTIV